MVNGQGVNRENQGDHKMNVGSLMNKPN